MHSHVHALGQCRKIIREHGLTPVIAGDTAGAAREVAEAGRPDPGRARARASPPRSTGSSPRRGRRGRGPQHHPLRGALARRRDGAAPATGPVVTSFVFRVRNLPAALYKALGGFATNGVNMTKLESYMVDGEFTATQFLRRGRRAPGRPAAQAGARGARVLLHRRADPRRLPGRPVPGKSPRGGVASRLSSGLWLRTLAESSQVRGVA